MSLGCTRGIAWEHKSDPVVRRVPWQGALGAADGLQGFPACFVGRWQCRSLPWRCPSGLRDKLGTHARVHDAERLWSKSWTLGLRNGCFAMEPEGSQVCPCAGRTREPLDIWAQSVNTTKSRLPRGTTWARFPTGPGGLFEEGVPGVTERGPHRLLAQGKQGNLGDVAMGKGGRSGKALEGEPRDEQRLDSPRETTRSVTRAPTNARRASQGNGPGGSGPGGSRGPDGSPKAPSPDAGRSFAGSGDPRLALLVEAARRGDLAAWEEIVQLLGGLVWAIVRGEGLGVADALDAVQTVWLRLVEHLQRLQDPAQLRSWIATVARREARRTRDKVRRVLLIDPVGIPDEVAPSSQLSSGQAPRDPEVETMTQEATVALLRAFSRLVPRQRTLLRLLVAEPELSYEEIAGILDMPVGSIGPTRARALERLAKDPELRALRS